MDLSRIFTVFSLVFIVFSTIGWVVFVGGFGHITDTRTPDNFQGHIFAPYWITLAVSPVLLIIMFIKGVCMMINAAIFRKIFLIPILSVIVLVLLVFMVAFLGALLHASVFLIGSAQNTLDNNAIFAGALLEVIFLGAAQIFFVLAYQFQKNEPAEKN